jgi:hypothetical protein
MKNASEVNYVVTLFIRRRRTTLRFALPGHNKLCMYKAAAALAAAALIYR